MISTKQIILFDGVCNLCNRWIQRIIHRDKRDLFRFATLQGKTGEVLLLEKGLDPEKMDSLVLIHPDKGVYRKSTAVIKIGLALGGGYRLLAIGYIIPRALRDKIYDWVAKNRYSWYGKRAACMIPSPELRAKFLDEINSDYSE